MDTTSTSIIPSINNYLPLLAFLVSVFALLISFKSIKQRVKTSAPKISGRYTRDKSFILQIQDYSVGNSLRIDNVYYRPLFNYRYRKIKYDERRYPIQSPPLIELYLLEDLVSGDGTIKVETSIINLYEPTKFILDANPIKWYQLIKWIKFWRYMKWYNKVKISPN